MQDSKISSPVSDVSSISFLSLLGLFFGDLLKLARQFISFVLRHIILLGSFTLAGVVIGFLLYKARPASYKLSVIVKPLELEGSIYGQIIKSLNDLVSSGSTSELVNSLKIPPGDAGKISQITARTMHGIDLIKDTALYTLGRPFIIEATVTDSKMAIPLQNALINYLNTNPYLAKLKSDRLELMSRKLAFVESELAKLDSMKTQYNRFLSMLKMPSINYIPLDPSKIYDASYKYYYEKNKIEEWIRQGKDAVVKVEGAKPSILPSDGTSIYRKIIMYGLIFFFIGCLVVLLRSKPVA